MIIENKDQLIDIYDIWYEPFWQNGWFYTVAIIVICAVAAVLIYYLYTKYLQKTTKVDCAIIALRNLDILRNIHIVTKQDGKDCYFSLSSIIKSYLACRYHDIFIRLTDKEIMKQAALYMNNENAHLLQQILQSMMLVRFEHEIAANQKLATDIELVEEFIRNTTPQPDTKGT